MSGDDDLVTRVTAALTEAGYPDIYFEHLGPHAVTGEPMLAFRASDVPPALLWMSAEVAGYKQFPCWSCWVGSDTGTWDSAYDCGVHGRCHHPDASRWPPRSLLQRSESAR